MIEWLRTAKSAYFRAKRKRVPKKAVADLFREIRLQSDSPSNNIFYHVKQSHGDALWSALAFCYERQPAFLHPSDLEIKERICGFLLLVEYREHIAIFKSNLDIPSEFKTEYLKHIADGRVEIAVARAGATFEQIRLRNMATSKYALRTKTLEANDLQNAVGPASASRYVPRGYHVRRGRDQYAATPDSGKISMRSDRVGYKGLIDWTAFVIDLLKDETAEPSAFIRAFARPIDLNSLPATTIPTSFAIDVPAFVEQLFDTENTIRLLKGNGELAEALDLEQAAVVLAALSQSFAVRKVHSELRVVVSEKERRVGLINMTKTRISLKQFALPETEDVYVRPANQVNDAENGIPIKRFIDQNDLFTVLFNDPTIIYLDGELYRDDSLVDGTTFLSYIRSESQLNTCTSEKGTFTEEHTSFDANSIFSVVVDNVAAADEVLVCDDLGDEWADFIGINTRSHPKTISFYHAKHREPTLSASVLHDLVGQAIKNLSRINLAPADVARKFEKWNSPYQNSDVTTAIPRILRGDGPLLQAKITDALSSPDTIRRVFIVTSSLSRGQLDEKFASFRGGEAPEPHFVQLYQLLMSYFSACIEVGACAYVTCRD